MSYRVLRKEAKQPEEPMMEASPPLDTSVTTESETIVPEPELVEEPEQSEPRRQLVPEFINVDNFKIRYVQPEPVPDFILFLQQLQHKDVVFVKIPVGIKVDKLYLHKPIMQLLGITGVHWDKIGDLIKRYNSDDTKEDERNRVRKALLAIVNLTIFTCDEENIEFLRETD
jgi:hypothetical protein